MKYESTLKCEKIDNTSNYALVYKNGTALRAKSVSADSRFDTQVASNGYYATNDMNFSGSTISDIRNYTKTNLSHIDTAIAAMIAGVLDDTDKQAGAAIATPVEQDIYALIGVNMPLKDEAADDCVLKGQCNDSIGAIEKTLAQNWVAKRGRGRCGCFDVLNIDPACYPAVTQDQHIDICSSGTSFWHKLEDILKYVPNLDRQTINKDNFKSYENAKQAYYRNWSNQPLDASKAEVKGNSIIAKNKFTQKYEALLLPVTPDKKSIDMIISNYNKIYSLWYNDKISYTNKYQNKNGYNSQSFKNISNRNLGLYCGKKAKDSCFTYYLRQDQKFNSCKTFQNGLINMAKAHGFDNLANDISQDRQCEPYNTSSRDDWKPWH